MKTVSFKSLKKRAACFFAAVAIAIGFCGCSGPSKPAERKAPAPDKPIATTKPAEKLPPRPECDMTAFKKIEIANAPSAIIEEIDDDYVSINGVSIANEPIDNAFGTLIDLNGDGTKEWIISYSGPDDTINAIFQAEGGGWRDIGAAYGAIMKCGPGDSSGYLDLHAEAYNGSGEGAGCDGMCDQVVYTWNGSAYDEHK